MSKIAQTFVDEKDGTNSFNKLTNPRTPTIAPILPSDLSAELVREYLQNNPEFFIENRALLLKLKFPRNADNTSCGEQPTINLLDKHREVLLARIETVENKYKKLLEVGRSNQKLSDKIHKLLCNLSRTMTLSDCVAMLMKQCWTRINVEPALWLWHETLDMDATATLINLPLATKDVVDFANRILPLQIFGNDAPKFLGRHDFFLTLPLLSNIKIGSAVGLLVFKGDYQKSNHYRSLEEQDFLFLGRFAENTARILEGHILRS